METLIRQYLRILDIDPSGYFIRLINTSHNQSVDLRNIHIRQFNINIQVSNSYTFHDGIRALLHSGDVVTIYSRDYRQLKFDIEPHIFIAQGISRWLTDDDIQTEISVNNIVFDCYKICSLATNDVPLLLINQSIDPEQYLPTKPLLHPNQYAKISFPYCLSIDNIVNPHTWAKSDRNEIKIKTELRLPIAMEYPIFQNETRLQKFKDIITKYDINYDFAFRLRALEGFEIVLILDDSSSMYAPIIDPNQRDITPFSQLPTRWDELKHTVSIVVDLASTLDPDGVDIYFLNRSPLLHATDSSQLNETFSILPNGPSPLTRVLKEVINLKRSHILDRKLLILIATDGLPTDDKGQNDLAALEKVLRHGRQPSIDRIYISFIACTNDLQSVGYLNRFDKNIPYVDVLDDYQSERTEILAVQGKTFPFSYGDYVVKILMGSIDKWFDQLDEKKVNLSNIGTKQQRRLSRQNLSTRKKSCTIS